MKNNFYQKRRTLFGNPSTHFKMFHKNLLVLKAKIVIMKHKVMKMCPPLASLAKRFLGKRIKIKMLYIFL